MRISNFGQQQAKGTSANDYDDIHVLYVQAIMILCYSLVFLKYLIPIKQGMTYRIALLIDKMLSYSNITCINSRYYFFQAPNELNLKMFLSEKLQFSVLRRKQIACQVYPISKVQYWFSSFQVSTLKDFHLFHAQRQEKHYPD